MSRTDNGKVRKNGGEKKKTFRIRWTTVLFYVALCVIIAVGMITVISLQKPVEKFLRNFEQSYETYKPKNQIQRIFDEYFAEPDIEELIALSGCTPEYNAPETYEDAVEKYAAKLRGKTMSYGYLAGMDQKVLNVKADGAVVACFSVKEVETKEYNVLTFKFSQPVYELDKIELFIEKPVQTANVLLPERYKAYANGMLLNDDYTTSSGIKDDNRESVPDGAYLFTYKVCTVTGLYDKPEITVKDEDGKDVLLSYDEEKNLYSYKYGYSEELKERYSDFVIEAMTHYAVYMQADKPFSYAKPYFDPDSQLYVDIYKNPDSFVWEHDGYRVENQKADEFFDYGGVISCRVTFDHILNKNGKEDYVDKNDHTVYMHKVDGEYKIFYMESH